jgi:ATP-dependent helicase/nuclease subunit A
MDGHAVRLMTVHASKGLEFPVVIVAGLGNQVNLKDARDALLVHRERGIGLRVADEATNTRYPSIASQVIAAEITRASLAEELRVLYVAMTRAREQLILVGTARSKEIDRWSQMAPDPQAALDEYAFLCCRVFLDWLVPLFASSDEATLKLMRVDQLPAQPPKGPAVKDGLGSLLPEGIARPYQVVTEQAIARLEYEYPHRIPVLEPAAISVTTMAKGGVPKVVTAEDTEQDPDGDGADLEPPVFVTEAKLASPQEEAATRGTVTHLVMQHFDFARGPESLTEQIDAMVTMKILTQAQADLVDQPGLVWFLETETGKLMREKAQGVLREVPFLDAIDPPDCPKCNGLDRVMLRGRIDALVPVEGGWMVVDYKTDWRVPEPDDETDRSYRRQVAAYRNALERSGQGKVVRAELIFVRARKIVEIR